MEALTLILGAVYCMGVGIFAMTWDEIIPAAWTWTKAAWHNFAHVHNHSAEDY